MKRFLPSLVLGLTLATGASAVTLNFDDQGLTGPSLFASATPQDVNATLGGVDVTLTGGTVLSNTSFLPANSTSVYGTADFFDGGLNPLLLTFSLPIENFFLDVFNGNTVPVNYTVADNNGNARTFSLLSNQNGGFETIGLAATGTEITITAEPPTDPSCCQFDFFVDNLTFNEALPDELDTPVIPLPASLPLVIAGLAGLGFVGRRRRS